MAVGLLATITIQEGKNAEFEEAFLDLTELVRANEPGNVFYALHRSPTDPQVYKVMEQYDSPEALDAHGKTLSSAVLELNLDQDASTLAVKT